MDRRTFSSLPLAAAAALLAACDGSTPPAPRRGLRVLVLGGTNFLGPAVVERAVQRGHELTLFNRGITRPELFPALEKLRGDRRLDAPDLRALAGSRRWDAVIDVWPELSAQVRQTADLLEARTDYYFFCSSIAVYRDFSRPGIDETAPTWVDEPGWYGGEKAIAEKYLAERFTDRFGVSRCHSILGPRDNGSAYHYWLRRLALEEEVLAPGGGNDPVQYSDVRDVAAWIVDCVEQRRAGIYNVCGPSPPLTLRQFLERTREAIGSRARLVWVDPDFLRRDQGVASFSDLPLWAPLDEDAGFYQIDGRKALAAGISYRPLAETARDAWRWYQSHFFKDTTFPVGGQGLAREREIEVLEAWQRRSPPPVDAS